MKTLKNAYKITLIILLTSLFSCKSIQAQATAEETLIVGMWVADGNSTSTYYIYESNGIAKKYHNNNLSKTYNWTIEHETLSNGIVISLLNLVNTTNPNEIYVHDINALNNERLVLVYQRPNGGRSPMATYFRQ